MKSNFMMDIDIVELLNLFPEKTVLRKSQLASMGGRQSAVGAVLFVEV